MGEWSTLWNERKFAIPRGLELDSGIVGYNINNQPVHIDQSLAYSFAAAGIALCEGRSSVLWVCPRLNSGAALSHYLHGLRIDALAGAYNSHWLTPQRSHYQRDLLVIAKEKEWRQNQTDWKALFPVLQGYRAHRNEWLPSRPSDSLARTVVIGSRALNLLYYELLEQQVRPFACIIDATTLNPDDVPRALEFVHAYFDKMPFVLLAPLGDGPLQYELTRHSVKQTFFQWREGSFIDSAKAKHRFVQVADTHLDEQFKEAFACIQTISMSGDQKSANIFLAVVCEMSSLVNDLGEQIQERAAQPWPPAKATLDLAISLTRSFKAKTLEAGWGFESLRSLFTDWRERLPGYLTGKGQAIEFLLSQYQNKRVLIVTDNTAAARVLRSRLLQQSIVSLNDIDVRVQVVARGQRRAWEAGWPMADIGILTGRWPGHVTPWLCGACSRWDILSLPHELQSMRYRLSSVQQTWLSPVDSAVANRWLQRSWTSPITFFHKIDNSLNTVELPQLDLPLAGNYPTPEKRKLVSDLIDVNALYLKAMSDEPVDQDQFTPVPTVPGSNIIAVHVNERYSPLLIHAEQNIRRVENNDVISVRARELEPGDVIALPADNTNMDLLDMVFDEYSKSGKVWRVKQLAELWNDVVNSVNKRYFKVSSVHAALELKGLKVSQGTVGNWLNGKVWGPEDLSSLIAMAELAEHSIVVNDARVIHNNIKAIQSMRRSLGKTLRKLCTTASVSGESLSLLSGEINIRASDLEDQIDFFTVSSLSL